MCYAYVCPCVCVCVYTHWPTIVIISWMYFVDKDVLRTDRDCSSYSSLTSPKLKQMEDILRTYVMYNFDLGKWVGAAAVN